VSLGLILSLTAIFRSFFDLATPCFFVDFVIAQEEEEGEKKNQKKGIRFGLYPTKKKKKIWVIPDPGE
jgi:hypothetical protein